jgi:hypothetical protein
MMRSASSFSWAALYSVNVRVVGERVDKRDGQRLDPRVAQPPQLGPGGVLVELAHHRAVAGDPAGHLDGVLQRGQWLGLGPDDPAGQPAGDERPGDLQHLPEALGGDQPDGRALALQDRVGGHRRPVQDVRDGGPVDAGLLADLVDAVQHPDRLAVGGGGRLGPPGGPGALVDEEHIGEGAADVDPEAIAHFPAPRWLIR